LIFIMNHRVVDNFLTHHELAHLQEVYLEDDFPWFWGPTTVPYEGSNCENELDNYQFYHPFYVPGMYNNTPYWNILDPIIKKLGVRSLLRIKGNLTTRTTEIVEHGYHVDFKWDDSLTAIYYVNSNDGYTIFEDGTKIESVENRIVIFPVHHKHSGTSCTNEKRRVIINFNYF